MRVIATRIRQVCEVRCVGSFVQQHHVILHSNYHDRVRWTEQFYGSLAVRL